MEMLLITNTYLSSVPLARKVIKRRKPAIEKANMIKGMSERKKEKVLYHELGSALGNRGFIRHRDS